MSPLWAFNYPFQVPNPPRYVLSTTEPQRLLFENESLRKRNLALETMLHGYGPGERQDLSPNLMQLVEEVEHLREIARSRLAEIEEWRQRAITRETQDPLHQLEKTQIERNVAYQVEQDLQPRMNQYKQEISFLRQENETLSRTNNELQAQLANQNNLMSAKVTNANMAWSTTLDNIVAQETQRIDLVTAAERKLKDEQISDLQRQIIELQNAIFEKDLQLKKINDLYDKQTSDRRLEALSKIEDKYAKDIGLLYSNSNASIQNLLKSNQELMSRIRRLEEERRDLMLKNSQELDEMRGKYLQTFAGLLQEEAVKRTVPYNQTAHVYDREIQALKQRLGFEVSRGPSAISPELVIKTRIAEPTARNPFSRDQAFLTGGIPIFKY